ncbi:probable esterase PIR7A [Phoenix dactylifera]|uniref:Probable esterase PIR7A n=1 Tax=Phoenix dactylifera TaxID=42345 RepID=A0A8B9A9E0_PHODC|nr:probable esterase PIR7A [Phoenix dactylifera]
MEEEGKKQFILVHGMCHGAWCWYKLATLLMAAGHRVTMPDLAACGVNPKRLHELRSFSDYSEPLMEAISSIPSGERVVLVAHSFGGSTVALAMQRFADKVSAAIFATAMMPSTTTPFATIGQEFSMKHPPEYFMDSKFVISQDHEISWKTITFGPNYMKERLYQLCAPEDLALATMLVRPSSLFEHDDPLVVSKENYGSVSRVFVVCKEDLAIKEDFQRWMIEQSPEVEVREIEEAGHIVMLSKPKELCSLLLEIAGKYP